MMLDYIIVGCGIAGISLAEVAIQQKKSLVVISDNSTSATSIAAGIYNPIVLKRFTCLENASQQLSSMHNFYNNVENRFQKRFRFDFPILRKFASAEEQNLWFHAADKTPLADFLSASLIQSGIPGINAPFGFGKVHHTGYVNTIDLLASYKSFLDDNGLARNESFEYDLLRFEKYHVTYKHLTAKHIIFAEGSYLYKNPYFNYLPLSGTKGEILTIRAMGLPVNLIIKGGIFLLPAGNGLYKVGSTYEWKDKTWNTTEAAKKELIAKLNDLIDTPYEVVNHHAGIRPTVPDRKPLLGTHPDYSNLHILNGLGTRGIMLGPYMADKLLTYIEKGTMLESSLDIRRFGRK